MSFAAGNGSGAVPANNEQPRSDGSGTDEAKKKSGSRDGLLLRLFQSEIFDGYYHMYYLYHRKEQGVHSYLVNLLYRRPDDVINFYLPQLCQIALNSMAKKEHTEIPRFLLDKAAKSMHLALKANWLFQSAVDDGIAAQEKHARTMAQETEMAVVNSKRIQSQGRVSSSQDTEGGRHCLPDLFCRRKIVKLINQHSLAQSQADLKRLIQPDREQLSQKASSEPDICATSSESPLSTHGLEELPTEGIGETSGAEDPSLTTETSTRQPRPTVRIKDEAQSQPVMSSSSSGRWRSHDDQSKDVASTLRPTSQDRESARSHSEQPKGRQKISRGFVGNTGAIRIPSAKVELPSPFIKLSNPFSYTSFARESSNLDYEFQQYIIKARRCDYFNMLDQFVSMAIEVSDKLAQEPDRSLRLPLMQRHFEALNTWMFCRRCVVAASEGTFAMTGLSIPLSKIGPDPEQFESPPTPGVTSCQESRTSRQHQAVQILRVCPLECKVLSSKKRAPYLLIFETADLDEDIKTVTKTSKDDKFFRPVWDDLPVYGAILHEVQLRDLYVPVDGAAPVTFKEILAARELNSNHEMRGSIPLAEDLLTPQSPLEALRRSMGITTGQSGRSPVLHRSGQPTSSAMSHVNITPMALLENLPQEVVDAHMAGSTPASSTASGAATPTSAGQPRGQTAGDICTEEPTSGQRKRVSGTGPDNGLPSTANAADEVSSTDDRAGTVSAPGGLSAPTVTSSPGSSAMWSSLGFGRSSKDKKATKSPQSEHPVPVSLPPPTAHSSPTASVSWDELVENAPRMRQELWGDLWEDKRKKLQASSPYGKLASWSLEAVLVKGGDDLRQELLASQLIRQFKTIFEDANYPLYLRPYEVLVTGHDNGIMEFLTDTSSVDALKRKLGTESLARVFEAAFADQMSEARKNFIESHAAYSLISYLLQVKDRHNGNLLLTAEGHLVHIDFGFMLANSPGSVNFETSPFKLTQDIVEIMEGPDSDNSEYFRRLIITGFMEARKHAERIFLIVELMMSACKMPCFNGNPETALNALKERFMLSVSEDQCVNRIMDLIDQSVNNWRTVQYDNFQRLTNGIW